MRLRRARDHFYKRINPLPAELYLKKHKCVFVFHNITRKWNAAEGWNSVTWMTKIYPSYVVNSMAADGLATQGARASGAILLTPFILNIPLPAWKGLIPIKSIGVFLFTNLMIRHKPGKFATRVQELDSFVKLVEEDSLMIFFLIFRHYGGW